MKRIRALPSQTTDASDNFESMSEMAVLQRCRGEQVMGVQQINRVSE